MIISTAAEKAFGKIQNSFFMIKKTQIRNQRNPAQFNRSIYEKSTVNFILNDVKSRAFLLRSGIRQGFPLSSFYST